ncbi:hypothetical protein A2526_00010 [candidate division WOR-1 bacterium RIFOXYD2_FULL_36_8]|uniref:Uncharacterized protein n=1 Tax=candidate division WOR-1 bacterium RIFOXYB2_FULL_36_35 TaxID=1802578 RepID=A0A1F4S4F0_UNCSA|nr:MAG: hypothetical protein A2230_08060 [candidate division WOR-1 bacterium RIFOXYA2_FULL_36_21]OGC14316.1 MAG: hypothetical protein A2282_00140 [candidate division WOR-1 bacterium RIFOXYA12_FULL_36_13]OGC15315.1 MAG: hypothetical protein A2290_05155 [candidate division WOR-1 bacterium RIFOXYB2_FULL_36_35]OGC37588.1 MAG: hypothetical protein A2526_00010 [candidate division WOR-1 bacterium RIFOXYD2_FULL_36_8]
MTIKEYQTQFLKLCMDSPIISDSNVNFDEIDENNCYISGLLELIDASVLYIAEYVEVKHGNITRLKYRYHWQKKDASFIARWDNVPHHKEIQSFPFHLHEGDKIYSSKEMAIDLVLEEIGARII